MTIFRHIALAALTAVMFSFSPTAQAAPLNLGALALGAKGTFFNSEADGVRPGETVYGFAVGTIPQNSYITFTYNFDTETPLYGDIVSGGTAETESGVYKYTYISTSSGLNGLMTSVSGMPIAFDNVNPDNMPVLATSDITTGTAVVTNFAFAAASFSTYFFGQLGESLINVDYAVSAVPLPAALPLFGLGLIGLAGYSRHKKARANAIA